MILIALGSNLASHAGLPPQTLDAARAELARAGVRVVASSPYYVTPAWPDPSDPPFVNAVVRVETAMEPRALLALLHDIEARFDRARGRANAPRTLDLDLIAFDGRVERGPPELPHPRLAARAFVLVPLADVAPDWSHPASGRTVRAMLEALPAAERAAVKPISQA